MSEVSTYIGKFGYTILKECMNEKDLKQTKKELSVTPFIPKSSPIKPTPFKIYKESQKKIYIPRFYGLNEFGPPELNILSDGEKINLPFNGSLRDYQEPIVSTFLKHAKKNGSGLLEIYAGAGKTCMGLYILSKLSVKTLIVVHKDFLLRQWIERIEQFLPNAKVGRIQGKVIDTEGKDIVIGMLQSLSMKNYDKNLFSQFGFTIYDEVHHVSAEVFSQALLKIVTKYSLGLSATMNRKDGLTKVIKMFLGDIVYKLERKNTHNVIVRALYYNSNEEEFSQTELNFRGQTHYSKMIKKICEFNDRSEFILKILDKIIKKDVENKAQVIILGHNKSLLTYLYTAIEYRNIASVGYYLGGMKEEDLKISSTKKIIIATYAMAEEGLDIKTLTTLIMATPRVDVTQAVGRILRKKSSNAEVYDIVDQHDIFRRHFAKRKRFYKKQNFEIRYNFNANESLNPIKDAVIDDSKSKKSTKIKIKTDPFLQSKCLI